MSANLLHEALNTHLVTDEGQDFLRGQVRQDKIRVYPVHISLFPFDRYCPALFLPFFFRPIF